MNPNRFSVYMRSVDASYLEEAQRTVPDKKRRIIKWLLPKVICLAILVIGLVVWRPWLDMQDAVTAEAVAEAGYELPKPDGVQNVAYSFVELEGQSESAAQIEFTVSTTAYTVRALHTNAPCNIEQMAAVSDPLSWTDGEFSFAVYSAEGNMSVLNWHDSSKGVQYALIAAGDKMELLDIGIDVFNEMGSSLAAAPEGAVSIVFDVFEDFGTVIRQTEFILDFDRFFFRAAELPDTDISGETVGGEVRSISIDGIDAQLSLGTDGTGKLIWTNASGTSCSLFMPKDAGEEKLLSVARTLIP